MIVVMIIISLGLLALIVYFAISPKSSRLLKLAAIIALGAICLTIIICGIVIIRGPSEDPTVVHLPVFPDSPAQAATESRISDIIIMGSLLLILALIIAKAAKDQRKMAANVQKKAPPSEPVFEDAYELDDLEHQEPDEKKEDEGNFDIEL